MTDNSSTASHSRATADDSQRGPRSGTAPPPSPSPPLPSGDFSSTSLLRTALLYSVANECTSVHSINDELATKNNPRPMNDLMGDKAEYWVTKDGNPWQFKFVAKLDIAGHYTKIGPYFNIRDGGASDDLHAIDLRGLQKAKAQIELRPLDDDDYACPGEAIANSAVAVETLLALCSEVEEGRNQKLSCDKRPTVIPFMRPHLNEDRYVFVVYTDPLFQGLPKQRSAQTPLPFLTRANIGQSKTLLNPSKARAMAGAKALKADRTRWTNRTAWKQWGFDEIPDPESRFGSMKEDSNMNNVVVQGPDVFESNGIFIHPAEYDIKLHDAEYVEVEVLLKLGSYPPNTKEPNGSHIYQLILKGMKVMPYSDYLVNSCEYDEPNSNGNGKRKAVGNARGERACKRTVTEDMEIDGN